MRIPDLDLPGLGDAVDFGGAATLGAEGSASFSLDIGIGLNHPTQFYLYDSSGLHGELALTGTDMAFKAGLGPLSLSIIDGQASIEGTVDVSFDPDLFTDGRKLIDVLVEHDALQIDRRQVLHVAIRGADRRHVADLLPDGIPRRR